MKNYSVGEADRRFYAVVAWINLSAGILALCPAGRWLVEYGNRTHEYVNMPLWPLRVLGVLGVVFGASWLVHSLMNKGKTGTNEKVYAFPEALAKGLDNWTFYVGCIIGLSLATALAVYFSK